MTSAACEACGEQNPPGTQFCLRCNTFLAWEEPVTRAPGPTARRQPAEELIETRVMPKVGPAEPNVPGPRGRDERPRPPDA